MVLQDAPAMTDTSIILTIQFFAR